MCPCISSVNAHNVFFFSVEMWSSKHLIFCGAETPLMAPFHIVLKISEDSLRFDNVFHADGLVTKHNKSFG